MGETFHLSTPKTTTWLQVQVKSSKSHKTEGKKITLAGHFFQIVKGAIRDVFFVLLLNCVRTKANGLPACPVGR